MKKNWLISLGILIYIVLSGIDRFIFKVPNYLYIPIAIIGITIIIAGFRKDKKTTQTRNKRDPVFCKNKDPFSGQTKRNRIFSVPLSFKLYRSSNGAVNLAGTQATSAGINTLRGTIYHCLNTLNIGFPSPVRTSVRVRNFDTKRDILTTYITLCHESAPPSALII